MSSVLVVTRSSDRRQSAAFEKTAARWGLDLCIFESKEANNSVASFPAVIERVRASAQEYFLLTDAFDVLVSRWNEQEVRERIDDAGGLLISCEAQCWPPAAYTRAYEPQETPWWAACLGQFCGTRDRIIELLETFYSRIGEAVHGGSTQEIAHMLVGEGKIGHVNLDRRCTVFQSMLGDEAREVVPLERAAFNRVTGTWPMLLHFNGRAPGMTEWEEVLCV